MTITLSSAGKIILPGAGPGQSGAENLLTTHMPGDTYVNALQNGDFRVHQRYTSSTTGNTMIVDRWYNSNGGVGTRSLQQITTNQFPGYYIRRTMTSAGTYASSTAFEWICAQAIEGANLSNLNLGTPSAYNGTNVTTKLTVSLWVRASLTGTSGILLSVQNSSNTWYYAYRLFTINTANKWEYKTVTFDVHASTGCPVPPGDRAFRMYVYVIGGCNTGYQGGSENTWTSSTFFANSSITNFAATNGATFDVARIQLEKGSSATQFETIPFALELKRCQRYYQKTYPYTSPLGTLSINGAHGTTWISRFTNQIGGAYYAMYWRGGEMRATPTVTTYAPISGNSGVVSADLGSWSDFSIAGTGINTNQYRIVIYRTGGYDYMFGVWLHYSATADVY